MSTVVLCDVCGFDLWAKDQRAEFKAPKATWIALGCDGAVGGTVRKKSKLDICFDCWHEFKDFVTTKQNGEEKHE